MTPAQKDTLACLVLLKRTARSLIRAQTSLRQLKAIHTARHAAAIKSGDRKAEALAKIDLDSAEERAFELRFKIIECGNVFNQASRQFDELPRESWLRALGVNEAEWHSPEMLKYGDTIRHVVAVLGLENSATRDDDIQFKPLNWCVQMAMFNATQTNPKLGEFMHNACNEMLGGVFGDYQPPTELQQIGVRA